MVPSFGLFFWAQLFRVICSKIVVDSELQIINQELYSWHCNFANSREWYPSSVGWRVMLWNYSLPSPAFFLSFLTDSTGYSWESPRSFRWAAWMIMSGVKTIIIDFSEISAAISEGLQQGSQILPSLSFFLLNPAISHFLRPNSGRSGPYFFFTSFLLPVLKLTSYKTNLLAIANFDV